jgi:hypothetical protein
MYIYNLHIILICLLKNIIHWLSFSDTGSPQSNLAVLILICQLLNPKAPCRKAGKEVYKPSKSEIEEAFITFTATEGDIPAILDERKRKYLRYGLTLQPFIIIVGNIENVKACKVVIDSVSYETASALDAVDITFKVFQATNACYQEEASQIWLFIQRAFYGITTNYDQLTQTVKNLLASLEIN